MVDSVPLILLRLIRALNVNALGLIKASLICSIVTLLIPFIHNLKITPLGRIEIGRYREKMLMKGGEIRCVLEPSDVGLTSDIIVARELLQH
jgi:hypothetical protein